MFVHVKYGNECGDRMMEFSSNYFITVDDVIEGKTYVWKVQYFAAVQ